MNILKKILRIILITLGVDKLGRECLVGVKPICYWILELEEIANLTKELE